VTRNLLGLPLIMIGRFILFVKSVDMLKRIEKDDDSCSRCGHISGDGRDHLVCPVECGVCGFMYQPGPGICCAYCVALDIFEDMSDDERFCMKGLLNGWIK